MRDAADNREGVILREEMSISQGRERMLRKISVTWETRCAPPPPCPNKRKIDTNLAEAGRRKARHEPRRAELGTVSAAGDQLQRNQQTPE